MSSLRVTSNHPYPYNNSDPSIDVAMPLHHRSVGLSDIDRDERGDLIGGHGFVPVSLSHEKVNKPFSNRQYTLSSSIPVRPKILLSLMIVAAIGTLSLSTLNLALWRNEMMASRKTEESAGSTDFPKEPGSSWNLPYSNSTSPLQPRDYEQYTVRVNTWKREKQLKIVLSHLLTCPMVAQIQVVWCTAQGPIPAWLHHPPPRILVEEHTDNSLNARFDAMSHVPTAGVLSQDDDVIRPCEAMDAGFALWMMNPDRMVGFDARGHGISKDDNGHWTYVALSGTQQSNKYSLALTRFAFLHRDYLTSYSHNMSAVIRKRVAENLNCEDIAMSFWISALTNGQPPLLADAWAMHTQMKLSSEAAISNTSGHKSLRHDCVNDFAEILHLKERLQFAEWKRSGGNPILQWGATGREAGMGETVKSVAAVDFLFREREVFARMATKEVLREIHRMQGDSQKQAYIQMLQTFGREG